VPLINFLIFQELVSQKNRKKTILSVWVEPEGPTRAHQPSGQARRGPSGQARGRRRGQTPAAGRSWACAPRKALGPAPIKATASFPANPSPSASRRLAAGTPPPLVTELTAAGVDQDCWPPLRSLPEVSPPPNPPRSPLSIPHLNQALRPPGRRRAKPPGPPPPPPLCSCPLCQRKKMKWQIGT
jgi:hypothetical protein